MLRLIHPVAGAVAMLTIAIFWLSTVLVEVFGGPDAVTAVKTAIPWGFLVLVPALAATGGSGFTLAKGQRRGAVGAKLTRMPFIAGNGLLVLIPSALFLASKARTGVFDTTFYAVQGIELVAGATNLLLLGLSMRDGLALTAWRRAGFPRTVPACSTTVASRTVIATDTVAIFFKRPAGFQFAAGQAIYLTLPDLPDADHGGRIRTFTIASAPHQPDLMVATRRSDSAFKRAIAVLPSGSRVEIEGPCGTFSLHPDAGRPAVFLAGGVGVTPFRSLSLDAARRGLPHRIFLFYSNRRAEDAAFLHELAELQQQHPRFTLIPTMTEVSASSEWHGERGYITKALLVRHLGDLTAPVYYVAGPPAMVSAMQTLLKEAGVRVDDVRVEAFQGY